MADNKIFFYRPDDAYGYLSNFYASPIVITGKIYPTSEHYYQSMKFASTNPDIAEKIRKARTPGDAFKAARTYASSIRPDWHNGYKDQVMLEVLREKFAQHDNLAHLLLETGDKILIEHTSRDPYWGDGGNGTGKNMLGRLLMQVRDELRRYK